MPFKIASNWASYTVELKKLSFSLWNDVLHYFIRQQSVTVSRGFFSKDYRVLFCVTVTSVQGDPAAHRLGYVDISSFSCEGYPETELMTT